MSSKETELDGYARPYIPLKWRQFNDTPAEPVHSTPAPWIDFDIYVRSFAGPEILPSRATPILIRDEGLDQAPLKLTQESYLQFFAQALSQETDALQKEYDNHALYNVPLYRAPINYGQSIYSLKVPGLRETSLRIEVGDVVYIRQLVFDNHGEPIIQPTLRDREGNAVKLPKSIAKRYEAVVYVIDRQHEMLLLRIDSLASRSLVFNASFTVQTRRMNALYSGLHQAQSRFKQKDETWLRSMLFPNNIHGKMQRTLNTANLSIELHDPTLNYEQQKGVNAIINDDYGRVPYIIMGPPGTGKTKTVVETTLQLVAKDGSGHIILCAPSESACDTLVRRLSKHLTPKELFSVNSPSRSFPEVPDFALPFCHVEGNIFSLPPFKQLMQRKVVVVPCRDVELLLNARLSNQDLFELEQNLHSVLHPRNHPIHPSLHWSGLIIDEAAQATEPEALLPLLLIAPPQVPQSQQDSIGSPLVVMVGDQHQLGPRTACRTGAIRVSLFERLLSRPLYSEHPLARSKQAGGAIRPLTSSMLPIIRPPFSDLIRNYRSHPAILAIPSSLFYKDTLEPTAESVASLLPWSGFKGRRLPVLFVDNRSPDEIEGDGGGWFNIGEGDLALSHARSFIQEGLLRPEEICIMSPFRAQVRTLRMKARSPAFALPTINIGPLEAFQGLESRLVILCTTRTRDRFIEQDLAQGLGVIHEPRRFNVALTRAKEGLIVIGNPHVLGQDASWASFIAFCLRTGANSGWSKEHIQDWQPPRGTEIEISKLEKQMSYKSRIDEESNSERIARKLGNLKLGMTEEEAFWESGISAEMVVGGSEQVEEEDDSVQGSEAPEK